MEVTTTQSCASRDWRENGNMGLLYVPRRPSDVCLGLLRTSQEQIVALYQLIFSMCPTCSINNKIDHLTINC
jgi:hypothetical protein